MKGKGKGNRNRNEVYIHDFAPVCGDCEVEVLGTWYVFNRNGTLFALKRMSSFYVNMNKYTATFRNPSFVPNTTQIDLNVSELNNVCTDLSALLAEKYEEQQNSPSNSFDSSLDNIL